MTKHPGKVSDRLSPDAHAIAACEELLGKAIAFSRSSAIALPTPPSEQNIGAIALLIPEQVQQGVGGRVWGVGEGEDGDFHPNLPD